MAKGPWAFQYHHYSDDSLARAWFRSTTIAPLDYQMSHDTPQSRTGQADEGLPFEWYYQERRYLEDMKRRGRRRVDQMVSGGAAGALVLSITFVDRLVSQDAAVFLGWLPAAWIVLLVALGTSLGSSVTQERAFQEMIDDLDAVYSGEADKTVLSETRVDSLTTALNTTSLVSLCLGIALLAVFVWLNLSAGASV